MYCFLPSCDLLGDMDCCDFKFHSCTDPRDDLGGMDVARKV